MWSVVVVASIWSDFAVAWSLAFIITFDNLFFANHMGSEVSPLGRRYENYVRICF